jgi:hypothetical protein
MITLKHHVSIVLLGLGLVGCAPSLKGDPPDPDRPTISSLSVNPKRTGSGCPVTISFRFEDPGRDVVSVRARWIREYGPRREVSPSNRERADVSYGRSHLTTVSSGLAALPVDRTVFMRDVKGQAKASLTPLQPGRYFYAIQVEDATGRKSNVLETSFEIDAQPERGAFTCN